MSRYHSHQQLLRPLPYMPLGLNLYDLSADYHYRQRTEHALTRTQPLCCTCAQHGAWRTVGEGKRGFCDSCWESYVRFQKGETA